MKNPVPFLDEEYLTRDKKPQPPPTKSAPRSAGVTKPVVRSRPAGTKPATAVSKTSGARVYWHPIHNGQCLKINISGNPDVRTLAQWRRLMRECQRLHTRRFEFDLGEAEEMGLAALALLLILKERQQVAPRDMVLSQCTQQLYRLLQWTGLSGEFTVGAVKADC